MTLTFVQPSVAFPIMNTWAIIRRIIIYSYNLFHITIIFSLVLYFYYIIYINY